MGKRKTPEDYHILARKRNFKWIDHEFPPDVRTPTLWECDQGHQWWARYDNIRSEKGCPFCYHASRFLSVKDYQALAKSRSFEWLDSEVIDTRTKTRWRCEKGHRWEAIYNSIRDGSGCPYCAGKIRKKPADYHVQAQKWGFKWLGPTVSNNHTKTWWECKHGHQWEANYKDLPYAGCPHCSGLAPKKKEDYYAMAQVRNCEWTGRGLPSRTAIKTDWCCSQGHEWKASYASIRDGKGCPYCVGLIPKTIDDYHTLAQERDFEWIGDQLPQNVGYKTLWQCLQGHRWKATYSSIRQGTGCPECADMVNGRRVSQPQRRLCEMVDGELNYPYGPYCLDIVFPDEKIAIEYDSWYWHSSKQDYDTHRDEYLLAHGWKILHVKANGKLPSKHDLDIALGHLLKDKDRIEIILDDWGQGPVFRRLS